MQIRYEDSQRQIQALAGKVLRRAHAAGARSVMREDIVSELAIAWCVARDKFDANRGVPFGAYLHKGMLDHINRWIQAQIDEAQGVSLDQPRGSDESAERSLEDVIPDARAILPDEHAERESRRRLVMKNLTGNTKLFVELIESDRLDGILEAARSRSEFAKSRGLTPSPVPREVTSAMVFDLMGLSRSDRHEVLEDLRFWTQR